MVPVYPFSVNKELLVPVHTVVSPLTVPLSDNGLTVIDATVLNAGSLTPFFTCTR